MIKHKMELSCKDLGMKMCNFKVYGKNKTHIENEMMDHAKKIHPEIMKDMSTDKMQKMKQDMDKLIHAA